MENKTVMALDGGTTGVRALAFDLNGNCLKKVYREIPRSFPQAGWVEQDPEFYFDQILGCFRELQAELAGRSLVCLGLTNQRETVVAWDCKTGRALGPALVWQCRRTADFCLAHEAEFRDLPALTGLLLDPYFSATKMRWLYDHLPPVQEAAQRGHLCMGTIDTWLVFKLTGGKHFITEPSNASRTLLYQLSTASWDADLLKRFRIDPSWLAPIVPSMGQLALTDPVLTGQALPITAILGDQQASLFAHGAALENRVKCTYGTGLFLMSSYNPPTPASASAQTSPLDTRPKATGLPSSDVPPPLLTTVAFQDAPSKRPHFALEGALFNGGSCIQWLRDGLGLIREASETEALALSVPNTDGVTFLPALSGLGAPYWKPKARAQWQGLSSRSQKAHLVRAVLEALTYQVLDVLIHLPDPIKELRVDGGGTANSFLMQWQADTLGLPVAVAREKESTALGVAAAAAVGAGLIDLEQVATWNPPILRYEPGSHSPQAKASYLEWKKHLTEGLGD